MSSPLPLPTWPIPIPWPAPSPGVGTPFPIPSPQLPPAITIPTPTPSPPSAQAPSFWKPFGDLFRFPLDMRFIMALIFILITVQWVDQVAPEYVWYYVIALLLGVWLVWQRLKAEGKW